MSLNPDPKLLDRLAAIQGRLRDYLESISAPICSHLRWAKVSQLHLTLLFFGDISAATAAEVEAELNSTDLPAPELTLGTIGCFPMVRQPKVLWLGVKVDRQFQKLQEDLIRRFAKRYGLDQAPSYPHVTLARVQRPPRGKSNDEELTVADELARYDRDFKEEPIVWKPEFVSLMRSDSTAQGAAYHSLAAIRLGTPVA